MLYTALIALLRDWFPSKDYNMSSLLTLLSLAEARENDENFKSALDLIYSTRPSLSACGRRGARVWRTDGWKGAKITWQSILAR